MEVIFQEFQFLIVSCYTSDEETRPFQLYTEVRIKYFLLLKTESLDNAILAFWLA